MKSIRLWSAVVIAFGTTAVSGDIMQDLQRALAEYRSDPCQVQHGQAVCSFATIYPEPAVSEHAQAALARLMRS